jgi:hypothetical protein
MDRLITNAFAAALVVPRYVEAFTVARSIEIAREAVGDCHRRRRMWALVMAHRNRTETLEKLA